MQQVCPCAGSRVEEEEAASVSRYMGTGTLAHDEQAVRTPCAALPPGL